jgi:hypothetical protein
MTTITVQNPWTKEVFDYDITGLTHDQLDAYVQLMDDEDLCELESISGTPESWLKMFADYVGPEEAGRIVLGS